MIRFVLSFISTPLLAVQVALAQAPAEAPAQPSFSQAFFEMMPMFVMVFFIFYFLVLKPQQAKLKSQEQLLTGLKKGDTVVTSGGLVGRVSGLEKEYIVLEIAHNVKVKVESAHVNKKLEKEQSAAANA